MMQTADSSGSGFGDDMLATAGPIDFSKAKRLATSGSTCDAYEARRQRRRVFVKRLKERYASSPRHRAAFDKEFDVGVGLKHPGLPEYREFYGDYIVMNFVDGTTLADMIAADDGWLRSADNIVRLLGELLDVIDYLHCHHVVHCDVKADNVMITAAPRRVMLIDLGHCYTDWLDDTSGTPTNFGLGADRKGRPELDFRGIGKIIDAMAEGVVGFPSKRFACFRALCDDDDATADRLRGALPSGNRNKVKSVAMAVGIAGFLCAIGIFAYSSSGPSVDAEVVKALMQRSAPQRDTVVVMAEAKADSDAKGAASSGPAAKSASYSDVIESEMAGRFAGLDSLADVAEAMAGNPDAADSELLDMTYRLNENLADVLSRAYADYEKRYSEVSAVDIQMAVGSSKACRDRAARLTALTRRISEVMQRRHPESYDDLD